MLRGSPKMTQKLEAGAVSQPLPHPFLCGNPMSPVMYSELLLRLGAEFWGESTQRVR